MRKYLFTIMMVLTVATVMPGMWREIMASEETGVETGANAWQDEQPETDAQPESSAQPEPETGAGDELTQPETELDDSAQPEMQPETEPDDSAQPEIQPETKPDDSAQSETQPETEHDDSAQPEQPEQGPDNGADAEKTFTQVDTSYWADALFIGDSRTVGLSEYADLGGADVFANSGMSVYKVFTTEVKMKEGRKQTLDELLDSRQYGKIYITMGVNELGYDYHATVKKYQEMLDKIQEKQPDAVLFLGANMHVTQKKSSADKIYNNPAINKINQAIQELADNKTRFYVDVNELFDDAEGNLDVVYTADDAHILGKHYVEWADWLLTKGII